MLSSMQNQTEPMDASKQFCPNEACSARGHIGAGNIRIHCYCPQRYRCQTCKKTFSARRGTMMEGLRTPAELVMRVLILLSYGCPIQARSEEHTSELQSLAYLVCRLLLEKKKT